MNRFLLALLLYFILTATVEAKIILPSAFTDNMVLQQNTRVKVWGWLDPWEKATVKVSWLEEEFTIKGNDNAAWQLYVNTPLASAKTHTITIKSETETVIVQNIVMGEVWICAGQSNMEWNAQKGVKDALDELPSAKNRNIRLFKVNKRGSVEAQEDVVGHWEVCDSTTLRTFSAVGYFFGKQLQDNLQVPIGLIDMAWGGSYIESWIPTELIELYPDTKQSATKIPSSNHWPQHAGRIYNGMVAPFLPFSIAGVIWYQGESNVHYPTTYATLQKMMVRHWRQVTANDFPFYYVQIAPYNNKLDSTNLLGARIREQQWKAGDLPKSGMVVTTDQVDNINDVHPIYKATVGKRLAGWALNEHYSKLKTHYKSPSYARHDVKKDKIIATLKDVSEAGIEVRDFKNTEIQIAGEDRVFHSAEVKVIEKNKLELRSDKVKNPIALRFAFRNAPSPAIFDKVGLPLIPFRTDNW